jgi:hypothetical protein
MFAASVPLPLVSVLCAARTFPAHFFTEGSSGSWQKIILSGLVSLAAMPLIGLLQLVSASLPARTGVRHHSRLSLAPAKFCPFVISL